MTRVVVVDPPATPVVIVTAYAADGARIDVPITPRRALVLAEQLLSAARSRLEEERPDA